jgi:formate hydrogenlyase subunit 4
MMVILSQLLILLLLAPLVIGWARKVKAFMTNRQGPSLWQPYFDLAKQLRKEVVLSENASWIFRFTPYLVFVATFAVALLLPFYTSFVPLFFVGDLIAIIYLLGLARFFLALGGLDAASAFGGLGSSREMSLSAIIEPAMLLSIFTIAITAHSTSPGAIANAISTNPNSFGWFSPSHLFAFIGLFIVAMAETGRIPVDNPATHLELTMVHEAMTLEYSGRYWALIEWAASMKFLVFLTLLTNLFFPWGLVIEAELFSASAVAMGFGIYLGKIFLLTTLVAFVECTTAKLRLFRVPDLLAVSFVLSLIALVLYFILGGPA